MRSPQSIRCCLGSAAAWWVAALAAHAVATADFSRYQVILDRRPFGEVAPIALPGAPDLAAAESFAKDYELKAIIDDGDKLKVCVLDKKTSKHVYLEIDQEISGLQLVSANYDKEEAVLKMGIETIVVKLHPDKDKDKGAAPAVAGAPGMPVMGGLPRKNPAAENAASPFSLNDQGGVNRKPFFSDLKKRGASPFQRMGTNAQFQAKSLESFFKPNTNMTMPFVSPFRPQAVPFNSPAQDGGGSAAAGQPVALPAGLNPQMQANPDQGYFPAPLQPAVTPFNAPVENDGGGESEE